ncbi:zinc-dependent metalloprotease [Calycomorphotria hydatis]|uniref:DUF5117 domain-containing protein n=1 Tax=Calycomorphotria hydatis TaxID=2528027 RepID=A0A517T7N9_9PLAN|nr:zinc-dependent metalloprotease [Calycomorphotria hydatis]QDT64391.1 hypothetical protein V22_16250 [Calycomorphotria hydatis]
MSLCSIRLFVGLAMLPATLFVAPAAFADQPDYPPHAEVLKDYDKVVSTADGKKSLWTIYTRKKDQQVFLELPSNYKSQKYFVALTVASGDLFAGLQVDDMYVYWREYNNKLALIRPNVAVRSTGDAESKASVKRLFTDQVLLQVPIVTKGPGGGPVIDGDELFVENSGLFFGPGVMNRQLRGLYTIKNAKAFPENIELAFEQANQSGRLQTLHYSISVIPNNPGYKPRAADSRIGYFTTAYDDLGIYNDEEVRTRYINRWHLEKADDDLKLSPPKKPIVFYIEHTTPIRYRRWVREGILSWNKAFENVGLSNAIEVYYQDAASGAHMEKDPEDVRYNFVRWLNNNIGTAVGPSRVNPMTGEILDADIVLTDGWIRHFKFQFEDMLPQITTEGFGAETLSWLAEHPNWDPRVRLQNPSDRPRVAAQIRRQAMQPLGGHAAGSRQTTMMGDDEFDGLIGRTTQVNGLCLAASGMAYDMAIMRMHLASLGLLSKDPVEAGKPKKEDDEEESLIDGMPEKFVGPLLAHLVAHEVGHTLGLRHNFKASSLYDLDEVNSKEYDRSKPLASSVMDYISTNVRLESGDIQGPYSMNTIGPYDEWAIEYGYSFDSKLDPILERVSEPELQYGTDEDTTGPDPLARRYDFGKDPLKYANEQYALAEYHRERLLEDYVDKGKPWSKARQGYGLTLSLQFRAISMMANWIGGAHVYRDKKGDPGERAPIEVVSAEKQRDALEFVMTHAFRDEAFGLSPEVLRHLTMEKWLDGDDWASAFQDATWPVHDRIMSLQASTLTMLMNPTTLRRVYDNEFMVPVEDDAVTLAELMSAIQGEVWSEILAEDVGKSDAEFSARKPMISSLRRNLQSEHLSRLVDLMLPGSGIGAASKPISNLAQQQLRTLLDEIKACQEQAGDKLDPYTAAHLADSAEVIRRALESEIIYNANDLKGGGGVMRLIIGDEQE